MNKLLIYIGKEQAFALDATIETILRIPGVSNGRQGSFIGAVFESDYSTDGRATIVRISDDLETITVEGSGPEATDFAVKLQQQTALPLRVIDMNYSFDFALSDYGSGSELSDAISRQSA